MLVIRKAQSDILAGDLRARFVVTMARRLAARHPRAEQAAGGPEAFRRELERGVERALSYGLVRSRDLAQFLGIMTIFGPRFDLDPALPWAGLVLHREGLESAAKASMLRRAARSELARRAATP